MEAGQVPLAFIQDLGQGKRLLEEVKELLDGYGNKFHVRFN